MTLKRSTAVDAALKRADRTFAKRPKKPPKKLIAKLKADDPAPGEARAVYRDGPVQLESAFAAALTGKPVPAPIVATLPLPAGRWVINAKANAVLDYDVQQAVVAAGATYDSVACELRAGADEDTAGADGFSSVLALQVVHRYTGPGLVQLQCYGLLEPKLANIKVTAVRVAKLKNQSVGG